MEKFKVIHREVTTLFHYLSTGRRIKNIIIFRVEQENKNYNKSMRYQFEYFHIYKGKLLLGETIENMEELLELAALEDLNKRSEKRKTPLFNPPAQRAASSSR